MQEHGVEEQVKIEMIREGGQRKSETRYHVVPDRVRLTQSFLRTGT